MTGSAEIDPIEFIGQQRQEAYELMFGGVGSIVKLLQEHPKPTLSMRQEEKVTVENTLEEADRVLASNANVTFYWIDEEDERSLAVIDATKFIISKWCRAELKLTGKSELANNVGNVAVELAAQLQAVLGSEKIKNGTYPKHRRSLVEHYGPDFTLDFLDGAMVEEMLGITRAETEQIMTQGTKNNLASHYIGDVLGASKKVKENFEELDPEKVAQTLGWDIEEVKEILTLGLRRQIASNVRANPLEILEDIKVNIDLLTTENIAQATGWDKSQVEEVFKPWLKKELAIRRRKDPMTAAIMVTTNLDRHLSDENIAESLGWNEDEVARIFTPALKGRLAVSYINDPIKVVKKIKNNLEFLTDQTIASTLGWTEAQVQEMFTTSFRKEIAVTNIRSPLGALRQVKKDFNTWKNQYPSLPEKLIFQVAVRSRKSGKAILQWLDETNKNFPPSKHLPHNLFIWGLYKCRNKDDPVAEAMRSTSEQVLILRILHARSTESFSGDFNLLNVIADPKSPDPLDEMVKDTEREEYRLTLERIAKEASVDPSIIDEMLEMEDPYSHSAFQKLQDAAEKDRED